MHDLIQTNAEDILQILRESALSNKKQIVEKPKLGCLMLMFNEPLWANTIKKFIDESDLNTKLGGYEKEPHATIVYGFNNNEVDLEKLKTYLIPISDLKITSSNISVFENKDPETRDNYCVVKFDLESEGLRKMNSDIMAFYNIKTDYPNYKPHTSIAYTDYRGTKYIQELDIQIEFTPLNYVYSFDGKQTVLSL